MLLLSLLLRGFLSTWRLALALVLTVDAVLWGWREGWLRGC